MPTVRRRPWGQLWAAAPWDGKARPPEPIRIPATEAARIDTPPPVGELSPRRLAWGHLWASAPWKPARPRRKPWGELLGSAPWSPHQNGAGDADPAPTADPVESSAELLAALPPAVVTPTTDAVSFDFVPADDPSSTHRMTPPTPSEVPS